jgi:integrase
VPQKLTDTFRVGTIRAQLYTRDERPDVWVCWCKHGKRYRKSLGPCTPKQARTRARELIETTTPPYGGGKALPLSDAVAFMVSQRWPDIDDPSRTKTDTVKRLATFVAWAGEINLAGISREEMSAKVQLYLAHRRRRLSAQSIVNDRRIISRLCSWLMQSQRITHWNANPASSLFVATPKPEPGPKHTATAEEIALVLEEAKGPLRAVVVLVLSGLRPAGCFRLQWSDVDFERGIVRTREKSRVRVVRLSAWAAAELKALRTSGPLWPRQPITFFSHLQALARRIGLEGRLSAYALRRAVVARLWSEGVPSATAAAMMGHSVAVAERHYRALEAVGDSAELLDWQTATNSATAKVTE